MDAPVMVDLEKLDDASTRTRAALREEAVADYAAMIQGGVNLDPALVI